MYFSSKFPLVLFVAISVIGLIIFLWRFFIFFWWVCYFIDLDIRDKTKVTLYKNTSLSLYEKFFPQKIKEKAKMYAFLVYVTSYYCDVIIDSRINKFFFVNKGLFTKSSFSYHDSKLERFSFSQFKFLLNQENKNPFEYV